MVIKGKDYVQYPPFITSLLYFYTPRKFFLFYKDKGHDTKNCFTLRKEIERLIVNGYLKVVCQKEYPIEPK